MLKPLRGARVGAALVALTFPVLAGDFAILSQPVNTRVTSGQAATFSVNVAGAAEGTTFQWFSRKKGGKYQPIPGATSSSYQTPVTSLQDDASGFFVRVASGGKTLESYHATLWVNPRITLKTQPVNQSVTSGQTATFTVIAEGEGSEALTYQWYLRKKGGAYAAIPGAVTASFQTPVLTRADHESGLFVRVKSGATLVESYHATLRVSPRIQFLGQPENVYVQPGQEASFWVSVDTEGEPASCQWYRRAKGGSYQPIPGATDFTFMTSPQSLQDDKAGYFVRVYSGGAMAESYHATLNVMEAPVIDSFQVHPQTAEAGQTVTLTWQTRNATSLILDAFSGGESIAARSGRNVPGGIPVTGKTSITWTVPATSGEITHRKTLTAFNRVGSYTAELEIVAQGPRISFIKAEPEVPGVSSRITGDFAYGQGFLEPGHIPVTSGTPVIVQPQSTTKYVLKVRSTYGVEVEQDVYVTPSHPTGKWVWGPALQVSHWVMDGYVRASDRPALAALNEGGLLIAGGDSVEVCDPAAQAFSLFKPQLASAPCYGLSACTLPSGQVLLMNGYNAVDQPYLQFGSLWAGLLDPSQGTVKKIASPSHLMNLLDQRLCVLLNGKILACGGVEKLSWCKQTLESNQAYLIDPGADPNQTTAWTFKALTMPFAGRPGEMVLLPSGKVLIPSSRYGLSTLHVFDPVSESFSTLPCDWIHKAMLLHSGKVLLMGSVQDVGLKVAQLDPETLSISEPKILSEPWRVAAWLNLQKAQQLGDGTILLPSPCHRYDSEMSGASAIYNPETETLRSLPYPAQDFWFEETLPLKETGNVFCFGAFNMFPEALKTLIFDPQLPFTLTPSTQQVFAGAKVSFKATNSQGQHHFVNWEASKGDISQEGSWQAPQEPGIYKISAIDGSGKRLCAQVTVVQSRP